MGAKKTLRSLRKARHGWFDYEVLDTFGDELGPFGCMVYMVLARFCYGGTRVCMSLRDMAKHARMGKDKVSESIDTLVELGLILEHKGATARSASCFDLLDVKDLLDEMKAKGDGPKETPPAVFVTDSDEEERGVRPQDGLIGMVVANHRAQANDATLRLLFAPEGNVASQSSQAPEETQNDCLPHRQGAENGEKGGTVLPGRQICPPTQTDLSATADAFNTKKEERRKEQPPTPAGGGVAAAGLELPFADCSAGDPEFLASLGIAAGWVRRACGIANSRKDRLIAASLRLKSETGGESLHRLARLAVARFLEYQELEADGLLRYHEGPEKFFGNGTWLRPHAWPIDRAAAERKAAAGVGTFAPEAETAEDEKEPIRTYLTACFGAMEAADVDAGLVEQVRSLTLDGVLTRHSRDEIERELQAVQVQMVRDAMEQVPAEELRRLRGRAVETGGLALQRMPPAKAEEATQAFLEREVLKLRKLPQLSLYGMPQRA